MPIRRFNILRSANHRQRSAEYDISKRQKHFIWLNDDGAVLRE